MTMTRYLLLTALLLGLAACVVQPTTRQTALPSHLVQAEAEKQKEIALKYKLRHYERLYRLGYPLLRSSSFLCEGNYRQGLGVLLLSQHDFGEENRDITRRAFMLPSRLSVRLVVPGSPAEKAGLRPGDELVQVGSHVIERDKDAETRLFRYLAGNKHYLPVDVQVLRQGKPLRLTVQPERICDYKLALSDSDAVNAFADGEHVVITKGMMRFAETDQELSLVLAHELAHNAMDHVSAMQTNATGGMILDVIASSAGVNTGGLFRNMSALRYSKDFESEADTVGLYIMARAGLPLEGAADFWRRMAAEHPGSIDNDSLLSSHPTSAQRFVAIEQTVANIQRKQASGLPLEPEYRH